MAKVLLEDMQFFAYHGHYPEEKVVGNRFILNLSFEYNSEKSQKSDELKDAVNYQTAYAIVKEEMKTPSHLLEHLGKRILDALKKQLSEAYDFELKISKMNPPMGGEMRCVSVVLNA
jgi:dihydroneopterin aldolase